MERHAPEVMFDPDCDLRVITSSRSTKYFTNTDCEQHAMINAQNDTIYDDLMQEAT